MCMLFLLLCRLSDCNWCTVGRYRGRYRCSHYCTTPHCPILPSPSHHTKCCRSPVHNYRTMQYDSGIKRSTDGIERQPQHCCKRSATARQPHNAQTSAYFTQMLLASTNVLETKKNVAKWSDDWPNNVYNCTSNFWFNQTIERMFILSSRWNDFFFDLIWWPRNQHRITMGDCESPEWCMVRALFALGWTFRCCYPRLTLVIFVFNLLSSRCWVRFYSWISGIPSPQLETHYEIAQIVNHFFGMFLLLSKTFSALHYNSNKIFRIQLRRNFKKHKLPGLLGAPFVFWAAKMHSRVHTAITLSYTGNRFKWRPPKIDYQNWTGSISSMQHRHQITIHWNVFRLLLLFSIALIDILHRNVELEMKKAELQIQQ